MKTKQILSRCLWVFILTLVSNNVISQKITTQKFLEEFKDKPKLTVGSFDSLLMMINPAECKPNKTIKSDLNSKHPLILIGDVKTFPAPCNLHKFKLNSGKHQLELISLGDMVGFTKTIMFPVVKLFNKNGNLIEEIKLTSYETRSPSGKFPFHIYSLWELNIKTDDIYFIEIASDNSSTDDISLHVSTGYAISTGVGIVGKNFLKGYPVKRSPYGKYRMKMSDI